MSDLPSEDDQPLKIVIQRYENILSLAKKLDWQERELDLNRKRSLLKEREMIILMRKNIQDNLQGRDVEA